MNCRRPPAATVFDRDCGSLGRCGDLDHALPTGDSLALSLSMIAATLPMEMISSFSKVTLKAFSNSSTRVRWATDVQPGTSAAVVASLIEAPSRRPASSHGHALADCVKQRKPRITKKLLAFSY